MCTCRTALTLHGLYQGERCCFSTLQVTSSLLSLDWQSPVSELDLNLSPTTTRGSVIIQNGEKQRKGDDSLGQVPNVFSSAVFVKRIFLGIIFYIYHNSRLIKYSGRLFMPEPYLQKNYLLNIKGLNWRTERKILRYVNGVSEVQSTLLKVWRYYNSVLTLKLAQWFCFTNVQIFTV